MADAKPRILAVTDLSPAGDIAIQEAVQRARLIGAALGIVHTVPTFDAIRLLFPQRLADEVLVAAELPRRAEATLRNRLEALGVGADSDVFVEQGDMADVIAGIVERWHPTLLVVGSPTDGAIGSVELVRSTAVPVVVARTSPATRRVVAGTDFSDPSLPALRAAADAATLMAGELVVVHAAEASPIAAYGMTLPELTTSLSVDIRHAAQGRLEEALTKLGIRARTEVCIGPPAPGLLEAASRLEAELLVIGTHGRTGLTRFLLGSVAESVIHRAPCTVLVTRLAR